MKNKSLAETWDELAVKHLKPGKPYYWSRYVRRAFSLATEIGLSYVQSEKVNLLKTDLWNEGVIEPPIGSVGKYQNRGNFRLYGIDVSRVVCFQAKLKVKKVHIIEGTIENLPFKESFFHIILDLSTSDHIPEYTAINVLQEYKRVLRKRGILVLIFQHPNLRNKCHMKYTKARPPWAHYGFSDRFMESLEKNFSVFEQYYIGTFFPGLLLNKMPTTFRGFVFNSILLLEYSKLSKFVLKNLGSFQVIIATKKVVAS